MTTGGRDGAGEGGGWKKKRGDGWRKVSGPERAVGRGKYVGKKQGAGGYSPSPLGPPTALSTFHR
jgi:hypothetical protein